MTTMIASVFALTDCVENMKIFYFLMHVFLMERRIIMGKKKRPLFHPEDNISPESLDLGLVLERVAERFVEDKENEAYHEKNKKKGKKTPCLT